MSGLKYRLDQELVKRGLVASRSQAESYIKLGSVMVNGKTTTKPGFSVQPNDEVKLNLQEQYVSRAALKLASVASELKLDFDNKTVLDVGSSTGGFTDYALRRGAKKVIAVDVGTNQLHPTLRNDTRIELHEKTDIRDFRPKEHPDIIIVDVSFISLREILPDISKLMGVKSQLVVMAKPQFEAGHFGLSHKGVIKNDRIRREVLKQLESWIHKLFIIENKADSLVAGAKGNRERFYLLRRISGS